MGATSCRFDSGSGHTLRGFMKNFLRIFLVWFFVIIVSSGLISCNHDHGISLARSKDQKDLGQCLELLKNKKRDKAIQCLEAYKSRHYGEASGILADLSIADAHFDKKEYLVAAEAYEIFIQTNPYHERAAYAYYKGGLSYLKATPKSIDRDQTYLDGAVRMLQTATSYYKNSEYTDLAQAALNEARLKQAERHFYIGRFYYRFKEYLAAAPRFQTIVTDYSQLGLDEESFYYLIQSLKKTEQKDLAEKFLQVFRESYPNSKYVKRLM